MGATINSLSGGARAPIDRLTERVSYAQEACRTRLLQSGIGLVEDLHNPRATVGRSNESFSPDYQVCLPYRGLFVWHVGHDDVVADVNQVLFVAAGESFHLSQPRPVGYAELIITPDQGLLEEVAEQPRQSLRFHPLFGGRSRRADFSLQALRARFIERALNDDPAGPLLEEMAVTLLREALQTKARATAPSHATRRLIRRTKEYLEENFASPVRLTDVGTSVGASPAYLTDVFRRVEGIPLHGYLTQLRLARALVELPHANDLTALALSLGFSSHSHFTAVFRKAFGCTPSRFRRSTRAQRPGR